MPGYVKKALSRFNRLNIKGVNSPIIYNMEHFPDVLPDNPYPPLSDAQKLELQDIIAIFLFFARAVDPLMITAVNKLQLKFWKR